MKATGGSPAAAGVPADSAARVPGSPIPEQSASQRARDRMQLWNTTFRSLYGDPSGEVVHDFDSGRIGDRAGDARVSCDSRAQVVARPRVLRRLLAPLVAGGVSSIRTEDPDFRQLVVAAMRDRSPRPRTFDEALAALKRFALDELRCPPRAPDDSEIQRYARLLVPEDLLMIEPAVVAQRDGVAKVSRGAMLRIPFRELRYRLDPRNWMTMGPFFEKVRAVKGEHTVRSDGWHGLFEELFVVDWSRFRLSSFHTFLKVDYTYDADRVRADYSLVYEVDHQFEEDAGYLEATRVPGRLGWCRYYSEKSVRLRNPPASMFAPMLAAVFLESGLSAMEEATISRAVSDPALEDDAG